MRDAAGTPEGEFLADAPVEFDRFSTGMTQDTRGAKLTRSDGVRKEVLGGNE